MKEIYQMAKNHAGMMDVTDKFLCLTNILRSLLQTIFNFSIRII